VPSKGLALDLIKQDSMIVERYAAENISADQITDQMIWSSVASVAVYFQDLEYTKIEQSPTKNSVDFIAAIGGKFRFSINIHF
jgi:hypothetical protein